MRNVDISLQSELAIIREISRVAERLGRVHDIILMIDLGDLREGIWPSDLLPTVEQIVALKGVRIAGIGTNLTCFGAIMPTRGKSGPARRPCLQGRAPDRHAARLGVRAAILSSLPLLLEGRMPRRHQQSEDRRGDPAGRASTRSSTRHGRSSDRDACRLSGELIEVKLKPSLPIGESGYRRFRQPAGLRRRGRPAARASPISAARTCWSRG